ncbi:tumor necrosis factor alpha-induced protein 2 [Eucyclogobius newberryi]|uniref:tumor necrosis factor alpha-induced protein 2 n=1 Tax=Eucyclogobius newberryi TaxID=166745 RepID=UPI003B5AC717
MRFRSGSADSTGSAQGGGIRGQIKRLLWGNTGPSATDTGPSATDTGPSATDTGPSATDTGPSATDTGPSATDTGPSATVAEEPEELLTFEDLLARQLFSEASQLLIDCENRLFLHTSESDRLGDWDHAADELHSDHQDLQEAVLKAVRLSLDPSEVGARALASAVDAMCKEDERDDFWAQRGPAGRPQWRPSKLRERHDGELRTLVEERMDSPSAPCSYPDAIQGSSIQSDILSMGRQAKLDLEMVAERVRPCYPDRLNICHFYVLQFHRVLAARLRKIAEFGLDDKDCMVILRWVNEYYPQILEKHMDSSALEKLLPPSLLQPLEEQYLAKQQGDMLTYIGEVLKEAKQMWINGELPKTEDGCFISDTAFDIIQMVNGAVTSAQTVLADRTKAQSLTGLLQELLRSYKSFLEEVVRSNKSNSVPTVKANLHCVHQFINVLEPKSHLFPDEVRTGCLILLKEMQQSSQSFLLRPVQDELKPLFKKLSRDWLKGVQFEKILETIDSKSLALQDLNQTSRQALLGRLHVDVSVEYVKSLIRGDKLKDSKKQHEAHAAMERDAEQLHLLLCPMGSQEEWLKDVLIGVAELLKLQDLAAIQMHVASMGNAYPDFSEKHVSLILKLKSNFTRSNRHIVKETLRDALNETSSSSSSSSVVFFSLVPV